MARVKTMEEFAAVSGISRPTISKYFNDPSSVRPSTRDRIEKALARFDYTPNIYAINQNRRLTKNVGIVVPYLADPFFAEIARQLERRCIEAGFSPSLFSPYGVPELEVEIFETLRSMRPAGVLLAPLGRASDRDLVARFCEEVPTVLFDSRMDGVDATFVGSDNAQITALIIDYLCRTGQPPCLFEMATPPNPNANKRRNGYLEAMQRLGCEPQVVSVPGEGWGFEEIGQREGRRVLAERSCATDTILCSNDRLAIGLLSAAYESGIRVNHGAGYDIRIAGMDDHPFARFTCPALTTVAQDYGAISAEAVRRLILLATATGDREPERGELMFEGHLVMRASA